MYIYIYIDTHAHYTDIYIYMYMYSYISVSGHTHIYVNIDIHAYMYICIFCTLTLADLRTSPKALKLGPHPLQESFQAPAAEERPAAEETKALPAEAKPPKWGLLRSFYTLGAPILGSLFEGF